MNKNNIRWSLSKEDEALFIKETTPDGDSEGVAVPLDMFKDMVDLYCKVVGTKLLSSDDFDTLLEQADWLEALESAGVDNWSGYDFAKELLAGEHD